MNIVKRFLTWLFTREFTYWTSDPASMHPFYPDQKITWDGDAEIVDWGEEWFTYSRNMRVTRQERGCRFW